jgi:hypothetical protein
MIPNFVIKKERYSKIFKNNNIITMGVLATQDNTTIFMQDIILQTSISKFA